MPYNWLNDPHYLKTLIREIVIDMHEADSQKHTTPDDLLVEVLKYHPDCKKEQVQNALESMSHDKYYEAVLGKIISS